MVMNDCQATVAVSCDACGGPDVATVSESVVSGRLQWVIMQDCPQGLTEAMGWDRTPEDLRQEIIDQSGMWFLRSVEDGAGKKVAVMRVLRDRGDSLTEVQKSLDALGGEGIPGTEVELIILADRLKSVGVAASVSRDR